MRQAYRPTSIRILSNLYPEIPDLPKIETDGKIRNFETRFVKAWNFLLRSRQGETYDQIGKSLDPPVHRARIQQLTDFAAKEFLKSKNVDVDNIRQKPKTVFNRKMGIVDAVKFYSKK